MTTPKSPGHRLIPGAEISGRADEHESSRIRSESLFNKTAAACASAIGVQEVFCDDGVDEDGDGLTDCADADCAGVSPCP